MDATVTAEVVDVATVNPDFFDIDLSNLDDFDFDLTTDEFCDAAPGGGLADSGIDGDGYSSRESTPDPGVTDGAFAAEWSGSMSEYVCELERFLLENDDDVVDEVVARPDGKGAEEEPVGVDDYFGDLLAVVEDGAGNNADGEECLDAREDDEQASRKRARLKVRGTAMLICSWGELEMTRIHLALMQVLPALWLPAVAPSLLCVIPGFLNPEKPLAMAPSVQADEVDDGGVGGAGFDLVEVEVELG